MKNFKDFVCANKIFKDKIFITIPLKYMIDAIKIEIGNLYFYKLKIDLCEIEISGLVPSKNYNGLVLKIYYANDSYHLFNIESFKTQKGNEVKEIMINFYGKFINAPMPESKFNYWNYKISERDRFLEDFFVYVLKIDFKCSSKKLNDMEFLKRIYTILLNENDNDFLSYWTFYFEVKLKSLSAFDGRKKILKEMFKEYKIGDKDDLVCWLNFRERYKETWKKFLRI